MEQRHCPECDAPLALEAKFCSNCGATLTEGSSASALPMSKEVNAPVVQTLINPASPAQAQGMVPVDYQQQPLQPPYAQPMQQPMQPPHPQPGQQPYQQMPPYPYTQGPVQQVNVVMNATPTMVMVQQKSVGVSLLLTFLFGPLGMFYSTVSGAVIMLIVSIVLAAFTLGISIFITWPICMLWGAVAVNSYNTAIVAPR